MRCSSCDRLIPDNSKICQYCGETFIPDPRIKNNQVSFSTISRKRFWDKVTNALSPLIGFVVLFAVIMAIIGISSLFDLIQSSKDPVKFSQNVDSGDPVWCVVALVEEPDYIIVTRRSNSSPVGGFVTPGDDSDVLCRCIDSDGRTVWMLLKYKQYIENFSGRDLNGGCKIFGRVKDVDEIVDEKSGGINAEKVFAFKSLDE